MRVLRRFKYQVEKMSGDLCIKQLKCFKAQISGYPMNKKWRTRSWTASVILQILEKKKEKLNHRRNNEIMI